MVAVRDAHAALGVEVSNNGQAWVSEGQKNGTAGLLKVGQGDSETESKIAG